MRKARRHTRSGVKNSCKVATKNKEAMDNDNMGYRTGVRGYKWS
jgi:hypothetical protein